MATLPTSVEARLQRQVAAERLAGDPGQLAAAIDLDRISARLTASSKSINEVLRSHLHWLPLSNSPAQRGLYLWGGVGRGKTMLMDWFYESLGDTKRQRSHFYHFMRQVHAQLRSAKHRADPLQIVAQQLAGQVRVICLDEFFVADIADAMILQGLLDGLFRRGVALVATSNTRPEDLYKDGLQRERFLPAIDLIRRNVEIMQLDGGVDYRLRQLEQAPTYLDSADLASPALLQRRFASLAGDSASGPTALSIEDRRIAALAIGAGMAWFEFDELCSGPRNQNDYIELARLYHTVFISNIPVFGTAAEDAARRFIMLIDEFYDRGVKIVVSAAAAPAELYRGERLTMEFQRASSRLIEMQAQRYLAGEHRA